MTFVLRVPSRLTGRFILDFPDGAAEQFDLDARDLRFVEPAGLVQLALLLHWLAVRAPRVQFMAPVDADAGNYLARMDLYAQAPAGITLVGALDPRAQTSADRQDVLVPLRRFRTDADVDLLQREVEQFLRGQRLSNPLYTAVWQSVGELCGNAASHSGSPCGGFLAAQTYQEARRMLAIGDVGVGIRRHLAYNPRYVSLSSDEAAIREAVKPGVTGTAEPRGFGFSEVQDQAEAVGRAELFIQSGNGWVRILIAGGKKRQSSGTTDAVFPGTLVQLGLERVAT
ncbi:MAG: hypothetical protein HY331_00340 [Chloroflexi bacterium]|nr:hypothetical protein [Chloroflexota bacterium]